MSMHEVEINNPDIKEILNEILWFYENRSDLENVQADCESQSDQRAEFVGPEYRDKIVRMGSAHNGFPESCYGYNLKAMDQTDKKRTLPSAWMSKWVDINSRLMEQLAVRHTAVATMYPPGGFISWHNNANANGFNLLFTWSETGEGKFSYIDQDKNIIDLHDRKGEWVCRYGHFGKYEQTKYPIVYHAADTDCWRITVAFVFSAEEASGGLQDFIIEELTTP